MPNLFSSLGRVISAIQNLGEEERKSAVADQISVVGNGPPTATTTNPPPVENSADPNIAMMNSNNLDSRQDTYIQMESDIIRLHTKPSSNNNSPIPVGPSNAVDLIVASAARAAADAALAEADVGVESFNGSSHINNDHSTESLTVDPISTPQSEVTTSRRKRRTAAKSVLTDRSAGTGSADSYPLELSALEALIERRSKGLEELFQEKHNFSSGKSSNLKTPPAKGAKKAQVKHAPPKKGASNKKQPSSPSSNKTSSVTAKKSQSPGKSKATTGSDVRGPPVEVFSGVPTAPGFIWKGWTQKTFQRQSGKSKGTTDSYWYTPINKYKFRSLTEVKRFNEFLVLYKDETKAYDAFKGRTS